MFKHDYRMKWWGWGSEGVAFDLASRRGITDYLRERFNVEEVVYEKDFHWRDIAIAPPQLSTDALAAFRVALGETAVSIDAYERLIHTYGKSYRDAIRLRSLQIERSPDVVVYPANGDDVRKILSICEQYHLAVVPFGGGTSVVGGLEPLPLSGGIVSVDLARMHRLLSLDETALYVTVEAGKFGPELEQELNFRGYTLGHFPQSFEFSTVGGWVATRSAGQNSTFYGKIEDLTLGLEMVTPHGVIDIPAGTHRACGPDQKNVLIGSEGTLGIITAVRLKIFRQPAQKKYVAYLFHDFVSAFTAARELMQSGIIPAMIRISDAEETEAMIQLNSKPRQLSRRARLAVGFTYFALRGFGQNRRVMMMVGLEGEKNENRALHSRIKAVFGRYRHLYLGASVGKSWLRERFFLPYLRDDFLNNGILIDTLETATTWEKIEELHKCVATAITAAFASQGVNFSVFAHISHLYREGASLYFTFVANQQQGRELAQWEEVKNAASEAIVRFGAPISHHHGIGVDHRRYFLSSLGETATAMLRALKHTYDPAGIMNPGKLL